MMMQALVAGGLTPAYSEGRERFNALMGDESYQPNEGGFYEVPFKEYGQFGFPKQYEGKLIKVLYWGLPTMAVGNYRVVLMRRDPEEIRQSWEAFTGRKADPWTIEHYDELMDETEASLRNRRDTQVTCLDYRDVVDHPGSAFFGLRMAGWPIHIANAVAAVDPAQCRFRRELLTVGI